MSTQYKDRMVTQQRCAARIVKLTFVALSLSVALVIANTSRIVQASDSTHTTAPSADIYVDRQNTTGVEDGSAAHPFNTVAEGVAAVSTGNTIFIRAGSYGETSTINRAMTLRSEGGAVIIGVSGPPLYRLFLPQIRF